VSDENFLSRWSRRKLAARELPGTVEDEPVEAQAPPPAQPEAPSEPIPLPPVESLTPESDFTPFMQAAVDPGLKRQALKKLFGDPRFNAMDGLDVYIDDYTKSLPIPEGWLEKMEQVRHLGAFKREEERKAEEQASPAAGQVAALDEKVSEEQPVVTVPSDTSSEEVPAPPVGESAGTEG
jgi:hypothetical protein